MYQMVRKLIEYLPPFIQKYREIKAIMDAEQVILVKTWEDAEALFANQFIQTATEDGIARYEKILGIIPKGTHTLDERRFNVLARMNEQLPYTLESLHNMLSSLCGDDGYTLSLDSNAYALSVKLALSNESNIQAVMELLNKIVPANISKSVVMFNTHLALAGLTHEQLAKYTHKGIREENL